jgi:hypothetical protein
MVDRKGSPVPIRFPSPFSLLNQSLLLPSKMSTILIFWASHLMKRQGYLKRSESKGYPAPSPRIADMMPAILGEIFFHVDEALSEKVKVFFRKPNIS